MVGCWMGMAGQVTEQNKTGKRVDIWLLVAPCTTWSCDMNIQCIFGDIGRMHVCKFLDLDALVRWDRAVLNKALRKPFHDMIRNAPLPDIPRKYSKHSKKTNGVVKWALRRGLNVISIELPYDIYLKAMLEVLAVTCPNLTSLSVYYSNFYPEVVEYDVFETFAQHFHTLTSLTLDLEVPGVQALVTASPQLTSFRLSSGTTSLYTAGIVTRLTTCDCLTSLALTNTAVDSMMMQQIMHYCRRVQYLEIMKLTMESPVILPIYCVELETLRLLYAQSEFVGDGVAALVSSCSKLSRIDLIGSEITDNTLSDIGTYCPRLSFLALSQCALITDRGVTAIASHCTQLLVLQLDNCKTVADEGVLAVATHCHKLQKLWMQALDISDDALEAVSRRCKELVEVKLMACKSITDDGVMAIAKGCPLLQVLYISQCIALTDEALEAIGEHCQSLTSIYMSHCRKITQTGIVAIMSKCLQLERIDMNRCSRISSFHFFQLVRCFDLKYLHMVGYPIVTDAIIQSLSKYLQKLEAIWLNNAGITDDAIVALVMGCPRIHTIHAMSCNVTDSIIQACKLRRISLIRDMTN